MKFVIQRVLSADVVIDGETAGKIDKGLMVLIGIAADDDEAAAERMTAKLLNMRIFEDENGKTNLSLKDVNGGLLLVSQFTLYADMKRGNRPSFIRAGGPKMANELYEFIIKKCRDDGYKTETGRFGADMKVSLVNDGPFTIVLDSSEL